MIFSNAHFLILSFQSMTPEQWSNACGIVWFGQADEHCASMRCTACSPVVMAASRVCQKTSGNASSLGAARSHRCMQEVMGEGFCNFCIADYMV